MILIRDYASKCLIQANDNSLRFQIKHVFAPSGNSKRCFWCNLTLSHDWSPLAWRPCNLLKQNPSREVRMETHPKYVLCKHLATSCWILAAVGGTLYKPSTLCLPVIWLTLPEDISGRDHWIGILLLHNPAILCLVDDFYMSDIILWSLFGCGTDPVIPTIGLVPNGCLHVELYQTTLSVTVPRSDRPLLQQT